MPDSLSFDELPDGTAADCYDPDNRNLLDRWQPVAAWMDARLRAGIDPHAKVQIGRIGPRAIVADRAGRILSGVNFASEDPLGLGAHPALLAAAQTAAARYGLHAGGAAQGLGLNSVAQRLEERLAGFLGLAEATLFPTGWMAGSAAIRALASEGDHVVIDALAPAGLIEAATRATRKVFRFRHGAEREVAARLEWIRAQEPDAGILVVTGGLCPSLADWPDLQVLRAICRQHDATLLVDVTHDLGAFGPDGRGVIGMAGLLGAVDVVTGGLGWGFAATGGFVAGTHPALRAALRCGQPSEGEETMSPVQAAVALAALEIVDGPEGAARRARLMANACRLRNGLAAAGFELEGRPAPIVPVILGATAQARRITTALLGSGAIVNLDEPPLVPRQSCRWRLHVMSGHSSADIDTMVALAERARIAAKTRPH